MEKIYTILLLICSGIIFYNITCSSEKKSQEDPFYFHEIMPYLNEQISKPEFLPAADELQLAYYKFIPTEKPKTTLIFYHGGGIYSSGIYQHMAKQLAENYQIATYLFDIRGSGNSQGDRGDASSAQIVWQDVDSAIRLVKQNFPETSLFLAGHSSGAGLIINYAQWKKNNPEIKGYILIAPFLGANSNTVKKDQKFITKVRTWAFIGNVLSGGWLFNHIPAIYFNYPEWLKKNDNKILSYYTTAMAMATTPYDAKSIFENIKQPVALFVGENDEQFNIEKVMKYKKYLHINKITAEVIPQATHLSILLQAPFYIAKAVDLLK